jgi:ubiquitin-protein ligase
MANIKRIVKDLKSIMSPETRAEGIYVKMVNDQMNRFYMMLVGPEETPYEGALFFFTIEPGMNFHSATEELAEKQYPYNPPRVLFYSPFSIRIHPNLYQPHQWPGLPPGSGKVCLSILGTWAGPPWVPMMTFMTIAQTILSILDSEPLRNEPGHEKGRDGQVKAFTDYCQYICLRETLERVIIPVFLRKLAAQGGMVELEKQLAQVKLKEEKKPDATKKEETSLRFTEIFADEIIEHFSKHKAKYQKLLARRAAEYDGKPITGGGIWGDHTHVGKKYDYAEWAQKSNFS